VANFSKHPLLVPKPIPGTVAVRWYLASDGHCHAREFYDDNPACKKSLLALAQQMAIKGTVGRVPENGHKLHGDYDTLWVLKPNDFRFIGFRHRDLFLLTNGARKTETEEEQEKDYRLGLKLRKEFFESLDL
jgi:hypothetical protein